MSALRPLAKVGIVLVGLVAALAVAWVAVELRQLATDSAAASAASGMYAAGDAMLGIVVFGVLALAPLALGLYWLRPAAWFWSALTSGALFFAMTGLVALAANHWTTGTAGGWMALLAFARIAIMPLSALAFFVCAVFAPQTRHRWLLVASGATDGVIFTGVVLVKFVLPGLGG